jgi:predicted nucleic acid-binding protein
VLVRDIVKAEIDRLDGDALIASTALEHGLSLVTANTKDFAWIEGIRLHNPIQQNSLGT